MKNKLISYSRIFLIVVIICTLSFTFYQSTLSPDESTEVSNGVSDAIEPIIPSDTPTGSYVHTNLRKIAHFIEFAALGTEIALFVILYLPTWGSTPRRKLGFVLHSYLVAPITALLDETIQVFTDRGPSITDVWIDTAGFVSFATLLYLIYLAVVLVRRRTAGIRNSAPTNG
jgi:VanZ family protein